MTTFPSASAPSIFSFDSKSIRAITDEQGASWFVLRDLLGAMDSTTKVTDAVASIEEGLGKGFVNDVPLLTSGGMQTLTIGAEPAATYLLSRSNTETGRRLNRFIHVEVLPSIRKTGRYEATAAQPSIQAHFQGSRWLVHMDQRGNLIFNPVDPEAFHVPAREFPAVISSAEFPSRLLPMVLAAAAERMAGAFDRRQRHPVGPSTATQPIPWAQAARYVGDPWHGPIEEWLIGRSLVTSHQILSDCLRIELARQTRSDQIRVGNIMVQLKDWTKKNVYFPETGKQRWAYVRVERA